VRMASKHPLPKTAKVKNVNLSSFSVNQPAFQDELYIIITVGVSLKNYRQPCSDATSLNELSLCKYFPSLIPTLEKGSDLLSL